MKSKRHMLSLLNECERLEMSFLICSVFHNTVTDKSKFCARITFPLRAHQLQAFDTLYKLKPYLAKKKFQMIMHYLNIYLCWYLRLFPSVSYWIGRRVGCHRLHKKNTTWTWASLLVFVKISYVIIFSY